MRRRYDLEPLRAVKKNRAEGAQVAASDKARGAKQAERAVGEVRRERAALESRAKEVADAERERLERGNATINDLMRAGAFESGLKAERARQENTERDAEQAFAEARAAEVEARAKAERFRKELEAVERHRDQWMHEQRRDAEAREQEATDDAWRTNRRKT